MSGPNFQELYERELVAPLFQPWAETLLDEVQLHAGARLLDVACGTGIVARLAKQRGATTVVGVDVSPDMLSVARAVAPDIDWRQGAAGALPLRAAERFDLAVCQQGLQFFPDRPAAVNEMFRCLAPGGRLAVSVWRALEEAPVLLALQRVAEEHVGEFVDQRHAFGDGSELERLLLSCGARDVRVRARSRAIRFRDALAFLRLNATALVGMSSKGKGLSPADRAIVVDAIVADSFDLARNHTHSGGFEFTIASNVAIGDR